MVMLTDLLERQRALEEENARIQRDLGILRQIGELAAQLDEPQAVEAPTRIPVESEEDRRARIAAEDAESEREFAEEQRQRADAERAKEEAAAAETAEAMRMARDAFGAKAEREVPAATEKAKTQRSSGEVKKVLDALEHFRGEALQADLVKKSGLNSGPVSVVCAQLEEEGRIRRAGKGGYQNKSTRWRLTEMPRSPVTPRVRKAMERDARKGPTQPPTHEGRILSLLKFSPGMTVPEIAAELNIPASTVGRLIAKLKQEGEVVDGNDRGHFRRVMA